MRHHALASRALLLAATLPLAVLSLACDDSGGRRAVGAVCADPAQCQSGICSEQLCIDPFSCVAALTSSQDPTFVAACLASLEALAISPNPATVAPGGSAQLTVSGALTSTTVRPPDTEVIGAEPVEGDGGGDFERVPAGLTAAIDLTRVARFDASNPEVVVFDEQTPGLVQVRGVTSGTFIITATVGEGELARSAQGQLIVSDGPGEDEEPN